MNNDELKTVLDLHHKWLNVEGGERANLRGAILAGADLRDVDLECANLAGAKLIRANLRGAILAGADLRGADLERANLTGANLSSTDLSFANLRDADLERAKLAGANLAGAIGNRREIKSIFVSEVYPITYTHDHLQIGCEKHNIKHWWSFNDERIASMDSQALDFWKEWKDTIKMLIEKSPAVNTKERE